MINFLSPESVEELLKDAPYEPSLGIRLMKLTTTPVGDQTFTLIAVKLDKGKQLIPHLHEMDGEILYPLTSGVLRLGKAIKKDQEYEKNSEDKILVNWDEPQTLVPGNPVSIQPAEAHHIAASEDKDCMALFFLPATHLTTDKKFVVSP